MVLTAVWPECWPAAWRPTLTPMSTNLATLRWISLPSIFLTADPISGSGRAGVYPSCHLEGGGVHPGLVASPWETNVKQENTKVLWLDTIKMAPKTILFLIMWCLWWDFAIFVSSVNTTCPSVMGSLLCYFPRGCSIFSFLGLGGTVYILNRLWDKLLFVLLNKINLICNKT